MGRVYKIESAVLYKLLQIIRRGGRMKRQRMQIVVANCGNVA